MPTHRFSSLIHVNWCSRSSTFLAHFFWSATCCCSSCSAALIASSASEASCFLCLMSRSRSASSLSNDASAACSCLSAADALANLACGGREGEAAGQDPVGQRLAGGARGPRKEGDGAAHLELNEVLLHVAELGPAARDAVGGLCALDLGRLDVAVDLLELHLGRLEVLLGSLGRRRLLRQGLALGHDGRLRRKGEGVMSARLLSAERHPQGGRKEGRTLSSFSFESLFCLKSSMSFSSRLMSSLACFCLSLDAAITSLNAAIAALSSATSATTCRGKAGEGRDVSDGPAGSRRARTRERESAD